jgi:deoxyadenosine/deoxycytidine kinase
MLIAIEGCIGAGKTTVAKGLATFRGSGLLLEDFATNPFLEAFYEHPSETAIETEFSFLLLHFHQLKMNANKILHAEVLSDFHLGKDLLYADLNLFEVPVRKVFGDLYSICERGVVSPDLIICLWATDDLIVQRIKSRNREFEQEIDTGYYANVNSEYRAFFSRYGGRKLDISMDEWDFVKDPELFARLSELVDIELSRIR